MIEKREKNYKFVSRYKGKNYLCVKNSIVAKKIIYKD